MARFILNQRNVDTADLPDGETLLDYIRYHRQLYGTKIGCREGDCGACTVLVGEYQNGAIVYRSMTACLTPLGNADGKHILTVEGINLPQGNLSPVQQAMQQANGTQCGFCTIGFVMSLTGFVLDPAQRSTQQAIAAMDGNICRCTGYKSIQRAADDLAQQLADKPATQTLAWLVQQGFVPAYLLDIPARLAALQPALSQQTAPPEGLILGGGTDLMVQRPDKVKKSATRHFVHHDHLKDIYQQGEEYMVGASVTATAFAESPLMQSAFPRLEQYMKWVSSTPIRNMATMAGNLVNASPIGDMTIFFLALNADIILQTPDGKRRRLPLRQFYKGYKQLDKTADETIEQICFVPPAAHTYFNFEKVCKREHLDIASVNSACQLALDAEGRIAQMHLSAGGVSATPLYLTQTVAFLIGKVPNGDTLRQALAIMDSEISPISDARGTAAYKRLLLRQLFLAHLLAFWGEQDFIADIATQHLP